MTRFLTILFTFIVLMSSIFSGCKGPEGPVGPPGPELTGNLFGFVNLTKQDGTAMLDRSGVQVTIEGTSVSTNPDSAGRWVLSNLKTGTYNISLSKSGFGTAKAISYQFIGGGDVYFGKWVLYQIPDYYVSALTDTLIGASVEIHGRMSGNAAYRRNVIVFFGSDSTGPGFNNFSVSAPLSVRAGDSTFLIPVGVQSLHSWGFQSGSVAYLAAYTFTGITSYDDTFTGQRVYTSFNATVARTRIAVP